MNAASVQCASFLRCVLAPCTCGRRTDRVARIRETGVACTAMCVASCQAEPGYVRWLQQAVLAARGEGEIHRYAALD